MDTVWADRVLALRYWESEVDAEEYVRLVDEADGRVSPEVADVLLGTFRNVEDYEVQEAVIRVLCSCDPEVYVQALLRAVPRLVAEAAEWAEILIGREIEEQPFLMLQHAAMMERNAQSKLLKLVRAPDFMSFWSNAPEFVAALTPKT